MICKFPPRFKICCLSSHPQEKKKKWYIPGPRQHFFCGELWPKRHQGVTFFPCPDKVGSALQHLQLLTSVADAVTFVPDWQSGKRQSAEELPLVDYLYFVHSKFSISNILIMSSGAWKPVRDDLSKCHIFHLGKLRPKRGTQLIPSLTANWPRE